MLKTVNSEVKSSWNQYTDDQYAELVTQYTAEQLSDPVVPTRLRQSFNTISNYEKFVISRLDFNPDIIYFNKVVENIYYSKDEMPLWFDQRFQRYLNNISIVKGRLNSNPNLTCNIRSYTDQEILEQYMRICMHDNNTPDHNNDGVLNAKVKFKISRWLQQTGSAVTLQKFRSYLQSLHTSILPTGCGSNTPDGMSWKRFKFSGSVFQLRPPNPRKRTNTDTPKGPPTKRQRLNKQGRIKEPCKGGVNCAYWLKNRQCRYQHTAKQIRIMDQKRSKSNPPTITPTPVPTQTPTPWKKNKKHYTGSGIQQRERCKFGAKCTKLERGGCPYFHPYKERRCTYCKGVGHLAFQCRKKKADAPNPGLYPRYNPQQQPNATTPNPHQSLAIQYFDGVPFKVSYERYDGPLNGNPSKVSLPMKDMNEKNAVEKLDELKNIQRSIQKQITALQKNRNKGSNVESAYEQFMGYANPSN